MMKSSVLTMMNLARLRTYREVMQRRSFSAAADALGYTQSSVSQQVAVLERELGATLVDRAARPVRPTPAGEVVLAHAEPLLAQALAVERELAALTRGETGAVRVGGFFTAWATFMPAAVAEFSAAHPGVQLDLAQLEPEPLLRRSRAGELDVGVVYRYGPAPRDEHHRWRHLLDDLHAVALPRGHRLAGADAVDLADLAGERWVSPPPGDAYAAMLRRTCEEHGGFTPQIAFQSSDIATAQPLVAAGLAVALLPGLGLVPRHAGVVVRPLTTGPPARSVWALRPAYRTTPAAGAMVDALVRAAERHRA
jgi:DNA-binding transcriptional LysR family regulator